MSIESTIMIKEKFLPGDELTIEDVEESFRIAEECAKRFAVNENCGVNPIIENDCLVFDSLEDAEKYFGGKLKTIDEVFRW